MTATQDSNDHVGSKKREPDKNGNLVLIDNAEGCAIQITGRNNFVRIRNRQENPGLRLFIHGDENTIDIGKGRLKDLSIEIGSYRRTNGVRLLLGDHCSTEPGCRFQIFTDFAEVKIGQTCMMSRDVTLRFGENPHLIFDLETGAYRDGDGRITIGSKVWIGEGSLLLKNASIGDESIVAARSVVSKRFAENHVLIGGVPASILRTNIQWFRNRQQVPKNSKFSRSIQEYDTRIESLIGRTSDTPTSCWPMWPEDTTLLFGIGAMKAGTTWLFNYLNSHPNVHFPSLKEVHYFDVLQNRFDRHHLDSRIKALAAASKQIEGSVPQALPGKLQQVEEALSALSIYKNSDGQHREYREYLLNGHSSQKVISDITPSYCTLTVKTLKEMESLTPNVKFVFIMRDPVDRLWSAIRMDAKQSFSNKDDIINKCNEHVEALRKNLKHPMLTRSDYKSTVQNLDLAIKPENLLYLFYEDMFQEKSAQNICNFLDIEYLKPDFSGKVNEGHQIDLLGTLYKILREILEDQYEFVAKRFGTSLPPAWRDQPK